MSTSNKPRIRPEQPDDVAGIRTVNEAAFDTPLEAELVDRLRMAARPFLSLVAEVGGEIVGHILFTPVTVADEHRQLNGLGLAPMAVSPGHQRSGIGSRLVTSGLEACRDAGARFVVVLGHPGYYPRFGFARASDWQLRYEHPAPDEAMMALELEPGAFDGRGGVIRYHPLFNELEEQPAP